MKQVTYDGLHAQNKQIIKGHIAVAWSESVSDGYK